MELTKFNKTLSDPIEPGVSISKVKGEMLFTFFKTNPLFRWKDANNDCEDRANAICILLKEWNLPSYKGWLFGGSIFKKAGYLKNNWKYHVAAAIPVREGSNEKVYIIDPSTSTSLVKLEDWAADITAYPQSVYLIKQGNVYIFPSTNPEEKKWYKQNKRNFNWTIQGLSGINGMSSIGKAQLRFDKKRVLNTKRLFLELKKNPPFL